MKKPYRRAFLEITNSCNLACGFCARTRRPAAAMPLELFRSAAAQAGRLAEVISLHLLGEPLTHPDFPAILKCCTQLGLKVNLVTNGLLLGKFPPPLFAEPCLGQVSISLHALSCLPEEDRGRQLAALARFAAAKPAGLTVGFRLRSAGEDAFFRSTLKTLLAAFSATLLPGAGYVKLADGVFLNFGGVFEWPGGAPGKAKTGCLGLKHHFGVLSDGRVVPCCADFDGALALGDIKRRALADILASPEAAVLRAGLAGQAPMPSYCASCGFTAPDA
ncbi:MAG: SPASM domain-containing protein [Elusimicrobiales bacterium]|nr:SPASM domain-containing protein [Elusimicrobiales bacterium]